MRRLALVAAALVLPAAGYAAGAAPASSGVSVPTMKEFAALEARVSALEAGGTTRTTTPSPSSTRPTPSVATTTTTAPPSATTCNVDPADGETAITAAINGCPNGSTVLFPANKAYTIGWYIEVKDRRDLTIDGNGSTFRSTFTGEQTELEAGAPHGDNKVNPVWLVLRGTNITLKNMTAEGSFDKGTARDLSTLTEPEFTEASPGFGLYGVDGVKLLDTKALRVWGDGVTTAPDEYIDGSTPDYTRNVLIDRQYVETTGRMCWGPTSGENITIQNSTCRNAWYGGLDAEMDGTNQPLKGHRYLNNTFSDFANFGIFVPVAGDLGTSHDFEIRGNIFLTKPDKDCNPVIDVGDYPESNPNVFERVTVADNDIRLSHGTAINLDHIRGGSVTGNKINIEDNKGCNYPNAVSPIVVANSTDVTVGPNTVT